MRGLVISGAVLIALALGPAAAQADNSAAAYACQDGGFVNYVRADGSTFSNTGGCVSYAAHGAGLVPVGLDASFVPDASRGIFEDVTVTGTGLEPGSTVTYSLIPFGGDTRQGNFPTIGNSTVAADGTFSTGWETGCPLDRSFEFYATTAYGQPITATGC
jgi:hypothetical protein